MICILKKEDLTLTEHCVVSGKSMLMYGLDNVCEAIIPGLRKFCSPSKLESDYAIFTIILEVQNICHT